MITQKYLDEAFPTLSPQDTGIVALELMSDTKTTHIPILEGKELLGLVSEEDVLLQDYTDKIAVDIITHKKVFIEETGHILEGVRLMAEHKISVLPVLGKEGYKGVIKESDVLQVLYQSFCLVEKGATLILEMPRHNYSLAEIAQILESEGILIFFSSISASENHMDKIQVHLKTNRDNLASIIPTLQRYELDVVELINEENLTESLKERYDALMTYLNV